MKSLEELKNLMREVAEQDHVISKDEEHLIATVDDFIARYNVYMEKAEADGMVDDREKARLKEMKRQILEGAWVTSMEDGTISDDESHLISTIYEYLKDMKV